MNGKKNVKAILITGFVLLGLGTVGLIVGFVIDEGIVQFLSAIVGISGMIVLIVGLVENSRSKAAQANISNPSTLAHKTYGGGGDYVYFPAIPNRKGQIARNAAINAVGAVGMFLGGGVFVTGTDSADVFVSSDELIINNRTRNSKLLDGKFRIIPATQISKIDFETTRKYERVFAYFANGGDTVLDIPLGKGIDSESVREAFSKLTSPRSTGNTETAENKPIQNAEYAGGEGNL